MALLPLLSVLCGWVYTLCWSASFYPQSLLNARRRSTSGTTVDFPFLNVLGFAAYLGSTAALYASARVRAQYAARHGGLAPTAQLNDVAFALHALLLSLVTASQYLARAAWAFAPAPGSRPSRFTLGVAAACVAAAAGWCALDVVYAAGYAKLVVALVKYAPQMVANWRNRSTRGWSIGQVLLDLVGGVLSIAQQALDSYLQRDWSGISGNPVKFALGNVSLVYDSLFALQALDSYLQRDWSGISGNPVKFALGNVSLVYDSLFALQHYFLYPDAPDPDAPVAKLPPRGRPRWRGDEEDPPPAADDEARRRRMD